MARCLVTGHKGYIGSKLYSKLEELGHQVMGIDLNDEIPHDILEDLREGDDGSFHPYYSNFQPEYVFHLACFPRVGYSIDNPVKTAENNILAGSIVLNFAHKIGSVKRVMYSSSSSIRGNGKGPESPYALQKYMTELETTIYSKLYGLDTVSLRYFNVYSEDQKASGPYATAISNWMRFIEEGKVPFITGNGEQRRDMLHVDDAIAANIFAMMYENNFKGSVFDVGTGKNISLNETREIVQKYFNNIEFEYVEARPGEVAETRADTKLLAEIGWKAKTNIESGINKCFKQLKEKLKC